MGGGGWVCGATNRKLPNYKRFAKYNWLCRCEEAREDESHLVSGKCKVYGDLTSDDGLVQFFTAVLAKRDQLDNFL